MPYIIRPKRLRSAVVAACGVLLVCAAPALASTACEPQPLSQPFLSMGDSGNYILAPGESADDFSGTGWTLSGGARIVQSYLADGRFGPVLELPGDSKAVSPTFCVTSEYLTARAMVRTGNSGGVSFGVSYEGTSSWWSPDDTGQMRSDDEDWDISEPVSMEPASIAGWQRVKVTLGAGGGWGSSELYDLYIDPYTR